MSFSPFYKFFGDRISNPVFISHSDYFYLAEYNKSTFSLSRAPNSNLGKFEKRGLDVLNYGCIFSHPTLNQGSGLAYVVNLKCKYILPKPEGQ